MTWSSGPLVLLARLVILVACLGVKLLFKCETRLRVVRAVHREGCDEGWGTGRGGMVAVRSPVMTPGEAQRSADATGLPRTLMRAGEPLPAVVVALGMVGWLCWWVLVSWYYVLNAWIVWTFDILFVIVAMQFVVAGFGGRIVGRGEAYRVVMLASLYNGDPGVVARMLSALSHQNSPPVKIHVVDDDSTQRACMAGRDRFIRQTALAGIYTSWQRTLNGNERHAQVHGFRKIRDADLFVTVDSGSVPDVGTLHEIAQPFSDPRVMPVAGIILAINNRRNLFTRVIDAIFVGQQLIDHSFMPQLGSVTVNSGGLATYRCSILTENIDTYLSESYLGWHVEFSNDSTLTLFVLLHGRTVQQPSIPTFAQMPDHQSHRYRQQERWFRGSFIRGLWCTRFLPVLPQGWWRQATGWMQIRLMISVFAYLLPWYLLVLGGGVPPTVVLVPLAVGLAQGPRYISVWYSGTTGPQGCTSLLLSPVATLQSALTLRPLRVRGTVTSAKMGWNTRQRVEVTPQ